MKQVNDKQQYFNFLGFWLVLVLGANVLYSQPSLPQRTLTVIATQPLHFGTFGLIGGLGGTVVVGYNGSRTSSAGIFLTSKSPTSQPAIFDVKLCQGRNVTISYAPTIILTGSNGGTLTLDIGPTEKGVNGSVFAVDNNCNFITTVRVGGTLHVPGTSPEGVYTGNFEITFDQQ